MHTDSSIAFKKHIEKSNSLAEVSNVERQLWKSVQSLGLLNPDVRNLYCKACQLYKKIFLGNNDLEELQEAEYSLWKLHYKQIDEFRKQASKNPESIQEGFRLFLNESSRFYQDLISKCKRYYGFQDPIEHAKLHKCRLVCHRLLVRLGDLARYMEINQNDGIQQRNWSKAAQCYYEAAKMYPDGGNPQNQLALLATPAYIGDEFLALYHCVRSIAVKEPFPDASDNLLFIFERNMSVHIHSLSVGSQFNFLKPSERVMKSVQAQAGNGDLWSLFVRLISFFFLELSLERFSCTFASTIRELEALLDLDDAELSIALESYQNVNISRPGPYRALQLISVLIFTVHNLSANPKNECLKKLQMALTLTFICMGRIVERCLKSISIENFPLLPTVMVLSEWLVEVLERVEKCEIDENLMSAISYFFCSYVELLNRLLECKNQVESQNVVALWEDFEMRGFIPISQCHSSLDFSTHWEYESSFRAKNEYRIHRIIEAARKIANRPTENGNRSWIFHEKGGKFCTKEAKDSMQRSKSKAEKQSSDFEPKETQESKLVVGEEEEDIIVFKPIDRYNSVPPAAPKQERSTDESLRCASSLLIAQNRALINSMTSHTRTHPETPRSSAGWPGPPSLSAWVLNDNVNQITADSSLSNLSVGERFCFAGEASTSSYNYRAPTPSALPLVPEDATWSSPPPPWPQNLLSNNQFEKQRDSFVPVPAVYTGSTVSMHPPTPSFVSRLYDQNALFHHHTGYERSQQQQQQQQQLLQYLKEKEWRIQQEAQIAHYANTRN